MVKRSLLGRAFTLCLVYVPASKHDTFLDVFIFVLLSSENLTSERDSHLTLNFLVGISGTRRQEFYSLGPFLTQNIVQAGVLVEQVLPSLKTDLFYSYNRLLITPVYYITLSGSLQDSLTQAKRGQMIWSISLSTLMTQNHCLVSQRHRKHEHFIFHSLLALEVETCKNQVCFHNGTLPSSSLYGIYKVVLKRKLTEKTSGIKKGENAQCSFISEINYLEAYKNIGAKKMLNKLLFLWCLLHALVSKKMCTLYQCSQTCSKIEKKRHAVSTYKVKKSQRETHIVIATRTQNRKIHYLSRTHVREIRVQVKAQHLKRESEGTKSSRGPDPEIELYKAVTCYFLDFNPLADTPKEADSIVLKASKDKHGFSSHRDMPLNTEFKRFVAVLTATVDSVLPQVLCTAPGKISNSRHSNLIKSGILFSLKEKACDHLKWKFRKEILIEDVRNKWTEVVLYKFLEPSQLSRQTWDSYSLLSILFGLSGKQFVQKARMNKSKPRLNANNLIYEILLVMQAASNPLHLRTRRLLKLIISSHKRCEYDIQVKIRSGYKFILRWSNATENTG